MKTVLGLVFPILLVFLALGMIAFSLWMTWRLPAEIPEGEDPPMFFPVHGGDM